MEECLLQSFFNKYKSIGVIVITILPSTILPPHYLDFFIFQTPSKQQQQKKSIVPDLITSNTISNIFTHRFISIHTGMLHNYYYFLNQNKTVKLKFSNLITSKLEIYTPILYIFLKMREKKDEKFFFLANLYSYSF